jgi:hypothetical protein
MHLYTQQGENTPFHSPKRLTLAEIAGAFLEIHPMASILQ